MVVRKGGLGQVRRRGSKSRAERDHRPTRGPSGSQTIVDLTREAVQRDPDRRTYTFLADGGTTELHLSNIELDRQARAIAVALLAAGDRGDRALLIYPPGLEYVAALFGCFYAGMIPVPVYPPDPMRLPRTAPRLQAIAADAQAKFALTTGAVLTMTEHVFPHAPQLQALHWLATDEVDMAGAPEWRAPTDLGPIAFLQYTSGSTGSPRGVMVTHECLFHNFGLQLRLGRISSSTISVSWLPLYHDFGLNFVLNAIYAGARAVLMSPLAFLQRPLRWMEAITRYRATFSGAPNFAYDLCVRKASSEDVARLDLSSWSAAAVSAEPVRHATLERFAATFAPAGFRAEAFIPCYGLAECTLVVCAAPELRPPVVKAVNRMALERREVSAANGDVDNVVTLVSAGVTPPGMQAIVVDPDTAQPCPADRVGEIWISSGSVAGGYWNRAEESAYSFRARLADGSGPFLRTGDLGFRDGDELYIAGRLKDLIIIRGRNLFPEDIELTVQKSHPAIRPGCGAVFSVDRAGEERLIIVNEVDPRKVTNLDSVVAAIQRAVGHDHEVAADAIVLVAPGSIAKTSSGKIQRHACRQAYMAESLEALFDSRRDLAAAAAPTAPPPRRHDREALENWLLEQAAIELGVDPGQISCAQPMVRWGMDSLRAVALTHRIETEFGVILPPTSFLGDLTIGELAREIAGASAAPVTSGVDRADALVPGQAGLSRGQLGLWFLHRLAPESTAYNLANPVRIVGPLDPAALRRALHTLVERHAALRTTFSMRDGTPVQVIQPEWVLDFTEEDAAGWSGATLNGRLAAEAERPFDLERTLLFRLRLFRRNAADHVLLLMVHHIVTDLWSQAVLLRDLAELYAAEVRRASFSLPALPAQYADFVRWQTDMLDDEDGDRHWVYWREQLAGELAPLNLPTDRSRPPVQTYRGASHAFRLEEAVTRHLIELGQAQHATLFMTLLAAFQLLLHRYTGQTDISVGSPMAARTASRWAGVIGYFVNPVVLRTDFAGNPPFEVLLARVRRTVLGAIEHQDFPFPLLVERLHPVRDPSRSPLFQVLFVLEQAPVLHREGLTALAMGQPGARMPFGPLELESLPLESRTAQFDLTLTVAEIEGAVVGAFNYNTDLFDAGTIARMAGHFETLLRGIVANSAERIASLPVMSEAERRRLLVEWNDTRASIPDDRCTHHLFEAAVERTPNAPAVVCEEQTLTYRELNERANRVANYLRRRGVGPDVIVGLCVERSIEMVVGLLGIMKAGGTYLPLDPAYPRERLRFMVEDARVRFILAQERVREAIDGGGAEVIDLERDWSRVEPWAGRNLEGASSPTQLAYVIYTSGSTGKPKGVQISHRALVNLLTAMRGRPGLDGDEVVLAVTSLSFDIAALEIFLPLIVGARLVLATREVASDGRLLARALTSSGATFMQATPSTWQLLLDAEWTGSAQLKALTGGEALSGALAARLREKTGSLWNMYGPTETTVWSTVHQVEVSGSSVPIGRPVTNTQIFLLDAYQQPVPVGVPGELHIWSVGLARGYLNRPELTAEKFVPHPFSAEPGERLYKSGDLARYLPDGTIEFLGRMDDQVKIRGHRIELGEIEAVLREHSEVREVVVLAREDAPGEKRLVAYVVANGNMPNQAELRVHCKAKLPEYMIPAAFVPLSSLPLSPNGKIARAALPAPSTERPDLGAAPIAPRTAEEEDMGRLFARVLGCAVVGADDNFFDLGGDSLKAVQLVAQLSVASGREVPVKFVFANPTVATAAAALTQLGRIGRPPTAGLERGPGTRTEAVASAAVVIERRPLLSLFAAGKIPPVEAAALAVLPDALVQSSGCSAAELVEDWCEGLPLFSAVYGTGLGRIALVLLPRFESQIYSDVADLIDTVRDGLSLADRLGARTVSLTGLLPSATDYGHAIQRAIDGATAPRITTGHATTSAAVVLTLERALADAGRDLRRESLGVLGLGSIGSATIGLLLQCLPHPRELILCDVYQRRESVEALARSLCELAAFRGTVRVVSARLTVPEEFYDASVIIGATNVAGVLDVEALKPGTVIVDDSAPHCFEVQYAIERLQHAGDILFTEGGVLHAPEPIRQLRYVPRRLEDSLPVSRFVRAHDPHAITGCILSSLLSASFAKLPATIGRAHPTACVSHYVTLSELGFSGAGLHCNDFEPSVEVVAAFRRRFGVGSG